MFILFSSKINNTMMAKKGHTYVEFEYAKSHYYNAQNIMLCNLRDTTGISSKLLQ